jgi:hypothetical protein
MQDEVFGQPLKLIARGALMDTVLGTFVVPQEWIDNLAFGGNGFEVVIDFFVIRFGTIAEPFEGGEPPFDPPYGTGSVE